MLSPTHIFMLVLVLLLALVVFGPKRLPELGSSVGRAIQEFKRASAATIDEVKTVTTSESEARPISVAAEVRTEAVSPTTEADPVS